MIDLQEKFLFAGTDDLLLALPKRRQKARDVSTYSGEVAKRTIAAELACFALLKQSSLEIDCAFCNMRTGHVTHVPEQTGEAGQLQSMWSSPGAAVRTIDNFLWRADATPCGPTNGSPSARLLIVSTAARGCGTALELLLLLGQAKRRAWFLVTRTPERA